MSEHISVSVSNVDLVAVETAEEANKAANEETAATGGWHFPGILFKQGHRYCISTAIPIRRIRNRLLDINSAPNRGTVAEVREATNRPVMKDHVATISQYLRENVGGRYILPPMTLNVQHRISVFAPRAVRNSGYGSVMVAIPETAKLSVTDGGHRANAIYDAVSRMTGDERDSFERDAVSVMITLENEVHHIHQDFADASKTKPLPKSQLAAYDRRNPANGLVLDLIERCKLFSDKIDSTSKTLSSLSTNLFLTNQVRQLIKELLLGDYAMADDKFEQKAKELLGSNETPQYEEDRSKFIRYVDVVTQAVPLFAEIAALPAGTPRNVIKERRGEGWICLTATGLVIIGRIGHELFRDEHEDWENIAAKLGKIDWSRDGALWQNNIVRSGKMTTQRAPVRIAVENVRRAIGLPANSRLNAELQAA